MWKRKINVDETGRKKHCNKARHSSDVLTSTGILIFMEAYQPPKRKMRQRKVNAPVRVRRYARTKPHRGCCFIEEGHDEKRRLPSGSTRVTCDFYLPLMTIVLHSFSSFLLIPPFYFLAKRNLSIQDYNIDPREYISRNQEVTKFHKISRKHEFFAHPRNLV